MPTAPAGVCPAVPSGTARAAWCQRGKPHGPVVFAPIDSSGEDLHPTVSGGETPGEQPWILGWDESFLLGSRRGRGSLCRGRAELPSPLRQAAALWHWGWVTVSPQAAEGSSEAPLPPAGWDSSGSAAEELQPRLSEEGSGGLRDSRAAGQGR